MFCGAIDWSATGDMLQGWGSILGALAIMVAAYFGSQTFKAWRQQNLSERKVEQAERILTATYIARRELGRVRSPAMWSNETDRAEEKLVEAGELVAGQARSDDDRRLITAQAYYNRLNDAAEVRRELEECLPMARALFGLEVEQALEAMNHHFWSVKVYVDANHRDRSGADKEFRRKIDSTIWTGYPSKEENEIDLAVEKNVALIEEKCLPALRLEA